jgi:hypothetical protein
MAEVLDGPFPRIRGDDEHGISEPNATLLANSA